MLRSHYMKLPATHPHCDPWHSIISIHVTIDRSNYDKCDKGRYDPVLIHLMDWIGFLMHMF